MSVLKFARIYDSSSEVILPVTYPDLPFFVDQAFRIIPERHPNLFAKFQNLLTWVQGAKELEKCNVELVGKVNALNAEIARLKFENSKHSRLYVYSIFSTLLLTVLLVTIKYWF